MSSKLIAAASIALAMPLGGCGMGYKSGAGKQIGTIVKMGSHGALCPTTEGEMALQNIRGGASGSSTLHFNVQSEAVKQKLEKAMEDRSVVEVTWQKRSLSGFCTMEGNMVITGEGV